MLVLFLLEILSEAIDDHVLLGDVVFDESVTRGVGSGGAGGLPESNKLLVWVMAG